MARCIIKAIPALFLFIFAVQPAQAQTKLSIATAGTTGVFYTYGGALASTISKYVPELMVTAEATGGSVENLKLISTKNVDMATTSADVAYNGFFAFKESKYFKQKVDARALFNMYDEPLHIVTRAESPLKSLQDLKGKRVVVGSPGSGTEMKARMVLRGMGIEYKDFTPEFLSFAEGTEALKDKVVDAALLGVLYPAPAVVELSMHNAIRLIPLAQNEVEKMVQGNQVFVKATIPSGTYKGVDVDTVTVSVPCLVVSRPDLPDEVAYKIVKAVFEHKDELDLMHSAFKDTTLENATKTVIPLHPGAIKYFKEKGVYKEQ